MAPGPRRSTSRLSAEQALGFGYTAPVIDPAALASPDVRRACFRARKALEQIVFDTVQLEGNPFTFPEVKTLLEGVTVGGHKLSDERQVLNQRDSWALLLSQVQAGRFRADKETFCALHRVAAQDEALTWGVFRDGDVTIAGTEHRPPPAGQLDEIFARGLTFLDQIGDPLLQAMTFFLFGSLNQFFYDVNKRASRLVMNGILLSAGLDAINIPARRKLEFNQKMIRFYDTRDGTEMLAFLASCSLDPVLVSALDSWNGGA